MGKAARRKREAREVVSRSDRPRWAGADGFEYAWRLSELYISAGEAMLRAAGDDYQRARAALEIARYRIDLLNRQVGTLETIYELHGRPRPLREPEVVFPGDWDPDDESRYEECRGYATAMSCLASEQRYALTLATPILFDPLAVPASDDSAITGLNLPFPVVTCDFLTAQGMSMPIEVVRGGTGEWVGLVAATMQQTGDAIDVWPVVTTLHSRRSDEDQRTRSLLFGRVRFGGELPEPPTGLVRVDVAGASAWVVDVQEARIWAQLWVVSPALGAASALRLLEAVNVDLQPAELARPVRRRAAREGADIPLEVVIRTSRRDSDVPSHSVDWQHRWTVRGHWKHFHKGPIFNANPRRRVVDAEGNECVRVWCPPFVKGPDDKPLVLKSRRVASASA